MLLAAVLLGSVSVNAQSNNAPKKVDGETLLEGDINGDGTVDVADMINIIKIMKEAGGVVGEKQYYWYAGTNSGNAVTVDNFIGVANRIPESEIPATNSVTADGQYIYFVIPGTKHLEALVDENGTAVEFTVTDAMGYHIYKTVDVISTTINYTIAQTIYYWYVGQTDPSSMNSIYPIVTDTSLPGWRVIGNSLPEYSPSNKLWSGGSDGTDINMGSFITHYLALPSNSIRVYSVGCDFTDDSYTISDVPIVIDGLLYYIYTSKSKPKYFRYDLY